MLGAVEGRAQGVSGPLCAQVRDQQPFGHETHSCRPLCACAGAHTESVWPALRAGAQEGCFTPSLADPQDLHDQQHNSQ
jgi:hypothetical protein